MNERIYLLRVSVARGDVTRWRSIVDIDGNAMEYDSQDAAEASALQLSSFMPSSVIRVSATDSERSTEWTVAQYQDGAPT